MRKLSFRSLWLVVPMAVALLAVLASDLAGLASASHSRGAEANPGTVDIQTPEVYSAVFAVSDVHGMAANAQALLRAGGLIDARGSWAGGRALLIVVGDSIDKGPNSLDLLDLWIRLETESASAGGRLVHLLGNHEAELLASHGTSGKSSALLQELADRGLPVSDVISGRAAHGAFLLRQPLAARVGRWLFCHAGLLPDMSWEELTARASEILGSGRYGDDLLAGDDSLLEARRWWRTPIGIAEAGRRLSATGFAGVVFGHQPSAFQAVGEIASVSAAGITIVKIDTGMAPEAGSHPGSMLKFPEPAELSADVTPQMQVISAARAQ